MILKYLLALMISGMSAQALAQKTVNVYAWGGEIPPVLVHEFERETGIKVNFSTFDSNETLYAKLKASTTPIYDVIVPSGYYVERMNRQGLLSDLNHQKLPNLKNLSTFFKTNEYDLNNAVSVPLVWGATGIFYNKAYIKYKPLNAKSLWSPTYRNQLLLLDDAREIFSVALLSLGYSPNDNNKAHIKNAYLALKKLIPNIKLFSSDGVQSALIDDDALVGIVWNGDAFKASLENKDIQFVYPKEGFVIWIDCLAIPKGAPHEEEAYAFINFMLKASSGATIANIQGHAITNEAAKALLPPNVTKNPLIYPDESILKRGFIQRDVSDETLNLYNQYWQLFKLAM